MISNSPSFANRDSDYRRTTVNSLFYLYKFHDGRNADERSGSKASKPNACGYLLIILPYSHAPAHVTDARGNATPPKMLTNES